MIPARNPLLHIYDASDLSIDSTAAIRRLWSAPQNIHRVPVYGYVDLLDKLNELVRDGREYPRALFETHGSSGAIYFGNDKINANMMKHNFAGKGYDRIFPYLWSRIYFNGCNVADDPDGWDFLDAAGSVFLRRGGGIVFAQTEVGRPIVLPAGHVHHFGATTAYSVWMPGGYFAGHQEDGPHRCRQAS